MGWFAFNLWTRPAYLFSHRLNTLQAFSPVCEVMDVVTLTLTSREQNIERRSHKMPRPLNTEEQTDSTPSSS